MISNIRLGFATNSSSTHSIVIRKPTKNKFIPNDDYNDEYFGWDFFTVTSKEAKDRYFGAIVYTHLSHYIGKELAEDLCKSWFIDFDKDVRVDHQSHPILPLDWEGRGVNKQFVMEYRDFLQNPNLMILGGNDNTDESHPLLYKFHPAFVIPTICYYHDSVIVARKDELGFWTLFDRSRGTKLRMSFSETQPDITYSSTPELVDLKITDYCNFGCKFCYQGSTPKGNHADLNYLRRVIYALENLEVFEVAIGGGEPTEYPQFGEILNHCHYNHIVPNFTTKNLKWLSEEDKRESWLEKIGGFAYSVTTTTQVQDLIKLINKYDIPTRKVQVQVVEGTIDNFTLSWIIKDCSYNDINLTLLGFKEVGRGKGYDQYQDQSGKTWLDVVKDSRKKEWFCNIGIDTLMAKKYKNELEKNKIPFQSYHLDEGKFSCYIDAVTRKMGMSSYENLDGMQLLDPVYTLDEEDEPPIKKIFNSFSKIDN